MRPKRPSPQLKTALTLLVTAISLLAGVANADTILVSAGTSADDDVRNGGFESTDNDRTAYSRWRKGSPGSGFESWRNYRFSQDRIGRNASFSPPEGKYRGIVNSVTSGLNAVNGAEPSVNTEHRIQSGDRFTLSFKYAGALGWTNATGLKVIATLYYDDDGDYQDGKDKVIGSVSVTPSSNANQGEAYVSSGDLTLEATSDSVGKVARLRFQTNLDRNIYAVIDNVTLKVSSDKNAESNPFVTVQSGDLPIVLSAPHGGREAIPDVPERLGIGVESFASRLDTNTDRLTEQLELGKELRSAEALESTVSRLAKATTAFAKEYLPASERGTQTSIKPSMQGKVHVGVYVDEGAGKSVNDLLSALSKFEEVSVTKLTADEIRSGRLSDLDILIQPGGSGGTQGRHLAEAGREEIRGFVRGGGGFIGICAGAYLASADYEWSLNVLDAKVVDRKHWDRGHGTVEIGVTDAGKQLLRTNKQKLAIHYGQGPLLAPGNRPDIDDYEVIATFETEIAKNGAPKGVMKGTTAIARGQYGRGRVVCFSPHPEMTKGLEQLVQFAIDHVRRNSSAQNTQ